MKAAMKKNAIVLAALSLAATIPALALAVADLGFPMFVSYFSTPLVVWMNGLPVFLLLSFFFLLFGRLWLALVLTGAPVILLALINYYKLALRNDPFLFADLALVQEAAGMTGRYTLSVTPVVAGSLLALALLALYAALRLPARPSVHGRPRVALAAACGAGLAVYALVLAPSPVLYGLTDNYRLVSEWSPTGNYVCRGVLYPFFHSAAEAIDAPPPGYDPEEAAAALAQHPDSHIPDSRKVDVIAVMLEAFNDFSKFGLDFQNDPYGPLHALEKESYHGELVTNIFAGETVNTERAFLTGFLDPTESFRQPVNSFVWYLRSQGYCCQGAHPGYSWFYNRLNVNEYLGFQRYSFYEDRYRDMAEPGQIPEDDTFLPSVLADYREAARRDQPYFSYNLTYQNHGPYFTDKRYDAPYLRWQEGYNEKDYNIANNYLEGVAKTCRELARLADGLRDEKRPVVLVLFGDHNPWWGDGNSTYKMFGINLDLDTDEGFYNYYCTPYLIWANNAARALLGDRFQGDGGRIGPYFLMSRLFSLCGWEGPAWMKTLRELEAVTPFVNRCRYLAGKKLEGIEDKKDMEPDWLLRFKRLEYARKHTLPPNAGG